MHISVSDEVLVATTVLLGTVAIFGPAFADQFRTWWLKPVLDIEFRMIHPDCHKTQMVLGSANNPREPVYYYRFRVTNSGRSQARKCEAVLEELATANAAGDYVPHSTYTPVRLIWGAGFEDFVDINPKRYFFCDLFNIPSEQAQRVVRDLGMFVDPPGSSAFSNGICLNVKSAFFSQPNRLPAGKYRLKVAIYSENAPAAENLIYVAWSGVWREDESEMAKECVARAAGGLTKV